MRYFDAVTFERVADGSAMTAELLGEFVAGCAVLIFLANCSNFKF